MSRAVAAILAGAIACAGAGASAAGGASPFPSGWIVFSADLQHGVVGSVLFRIRTNGTGLRQLTRAGSAAEDPAFAPDGKRVAFRRHGILTVKIDGSGLRRLTHGTEDRFPSYSPDGKRIAFIRNFRLYVMRADGSRQHVLPQAPRVAGPPSWTRTGKSIVLAAEYSDAVLLYTVDSRTGQVGKRAILGDGTEGDYSAARLSPNGRSVVFVGPRPLGGYALYRQPPAGGHARVVCDCGPASWSADSHVLLFENARRQLELRVLGDGRRRTIAISADKPISGEGPPVLQP